jgi:hypothetical protein
MVKIKAGETRQSKRTDGVNNCNGNWTIHRVDVGFVLLLVKRWDVFTPRIHKTRLNFSEQRQIADKEKIYEIFICRPREWVIRKKCSNFRGGAEGSFSSSAS